MELLITLTVGGAAIVGTVWLCMHVPDKPTYDPSKFPKHKDTGIGLLGLLLGLGMIGHSAAKGWRNGGTNKR